MIFRSTSRRVHKAAIGLGIALAVSVVTVPAGNAKSVPQATSKNNITIMINEPDAGWCNQDSPGIDQVSAKNAVVETLTIMNNQNKIVPYLAKSVIGSNGSKTWTIRLRPGIFFTDGEELTSATVSLNMMANLGLIKAFTGKGQAGSLPAIAWQGMMPTKTAAAWASNVKIIDKYTIVLNLAVARPNFPYNLWSFGRTTMMSSKALMDPNCGTTVVVGTGPFKIKSKGVDQFTTVLEANPNYWRSTAANKLPKAKVVTFKYVNDAAQRVNALRSGQADIATFGATAGVQINLLKTLSSTITLFGGPRNSTWNMHLNTTVLPFKSKNAREAFAFALDTVSFTKLMTKGNANPASSIGSAEHPYFQPDISLKFNIAKAKLRAAAYKVETGKDLAIVMPITTTTESVKAAQAVCRMMKAAGIACSLMSPVTSSQYILRGFALGQQLSWFNVVTGTYADFANLFATDTFLELSGFRFTNPALAKCFASAAQVDTRKAYAPCVKELQRQSYWIPTYTEGGFLAWTNTTKGIGATPLLGGGFRPIISGSGFDFASVTKG